jgi:hypothetical protein
MLTLHTIWRLDVLGWSLKRAAAVAGMLEARRLAEYVWRHTSVRPGKLLSNGGFNTTLERASTALSRR